MTRARGFTLIELLVAVTVLAVMAAIAYGGLNSIIEQYRRTEGAVERMVALQRTLVLLSNDLVQLQPRSVREPFHGDPEGAFVAAESADYQVVFTRGGWSNPAGRRRATLQRVAWRLNPDEGRIERAHWQLLDRAQDALPVITPLADGVEELRWRFMDASGEWQEFWPPADAPGAGPAAMPRGVEVTLVLDDDTEIVRVFALEG